MRQCGPPVAWSEFTNLCPSQNLKNYHDRMYADGHVGQASDQWYDAFYILRLIGQKQETHLIGERIYKREILIIS